MTPDLLHTLLFVPVIVVIFILINKAADNNDMNFNIFSIVTMFIALLFFVIIDKVYPLINTKEDFWFKYLAVLNACFVLIVGSTAILNFLTKVGTSLKYEFLVDSSGKICAIKLYNKKDIPIHITQIYLRKLTEKSLLGSKYEYYPLGNKYALPINIAGFRVETVKLHKKIALDLLKKEKVVLVVPHKPDYIINPEIKKRVFLKERLINEKDSFFD